MKRIYVVIEFNGYDAIAQGAFETEDAAYAAMEEWRENKTSNWVVTSCILNDF